MGNTPAMEAAEIRAGKPLKEVILDLYAEHGNMAVVAEKLGITRHSLWNWRLRLGITDTDIQLARLERQAANGEAEADE